MLTTDKADKAAEGERRPALSKDQLAADVE